LQAHIHHHLFIIPRGGRTAAILASLTTTCRRYEIAPQLYLTQFAVELSFLVRT
jgi:hypothetical protein